MSDRTPGALRVNGRSVPLDSVPPDERLLDTLRWRLGLRGTKEGCRSGECGACTVLVDGDGRLSCLALTHELDGSSGTTIEGAGADPIGGRSSGRSPRRGRCSAATARRGSSWR